MSIKNILLSLAISSTAFSLQAAPKIEPKCEQHILEMMKSVATIGFGNCGVPYYSGITSIEATDKTSPYSVAYGMPILDVRAQYEDWLEFKFLVHPALEGEGCIVTEMTNYAR